MYRTLLGEAGFKKGMKLYFERHDGGAVTCDDFRAAMADANGVDLSQFENWYCQAGTPVLEVSHSYDESRRAFSITFKQHTPSTPGQEAGSKKPLMIPVVVGLLSASSGRELLPSTTLTVTQPEQTFTLENVAESPIPSILRDFSAPVKVVLAAPQSDAELAFLMAHDTDSFNRWDAGNRLATRVILSLAKLPLDSIATAPLPTELVDAVRVILTTCAAAGAATDLDPSLVAYALQLPDEMTLSQEMQVIDPDALNAARKRVKAGLSTALTAELHAAYAATAAQSAEYVFSSAEVGRRRLRNTILDYISASPDNQPAAVALIKAQYDSAQCMTEKIAALGCLVSKQGVPERQDAITSFHRDAAGDALVLNKWFAIQGMADTPDLLDQVKTLKNHPDFLIANPNRARSLISSFAGNMKHFHAKDGQGYAFIADCVLQLDKLNPQVASRLATAFSQWKRMDSGRQALIKEQLERIQGTEGLSKDTFEIVSRTTK